VTYLLRAGLKALAWDLAAPIGSRLILLIATFGESLHPLLSVSKTELISFGCFCSQVKSGSSKASRVSFLTLRSPRIKAGDSS